ncbi:cytochrome c [Variovorax sp. J22R133]|uniref:c-type cytochrome n=1 Tax=Variovorax brevis TaxID=3053503 RepID=UPI002577A2BE|nr:cytochrome c [Variovorax sp. J22R133]MDM0112734.1 cytochrome c [Variovorax sp. J22R133]
MIVALLGGFATVDMATAQSARRPMDDPRIAAAWQALRTVNCERCHGAGHDGHAAPSIVDYARTQSRESFVRMVLDGNPPRGMPPYRGNPLVEANIEGIHLYFAGRADGSIAQGDRPPPP